VKAAGSIDNAPSGCVFCTAQAKADGPDNWIVLREPLAFVILNIYPYNSGHVMVCPNRHVTALSELTPEEGAALFSLTSRTVDLLRSAMNAEAVNMGANLGRVAGGSIDHVHVHLVPRWTGDTNFMPVIGETKVMVQMLSDTWARLREAVEKRGGAAT
jgi:ATP adenylyltransferase